MAYERDRLRRVPPQRVHVHQCNIGHSEFWLVGADAWGDVVQCRQRRRGQPKNRGMGRRIIRKVTIIVIEKLDLGIGTLAGEQFIKLNVGPKLISRTGCAVRRRDAIRFDAGSRSWSVSLGISRQLPLKNSRCYVTENLFRSIAIISMKLWSR